VQAKVAKAFKAASAAATAAAHSQKLGFLGEGPWAHVKEGDAHHPKGGGGEFFGRESTLEKDGGKDGQGGIIVDRWMWDAPSAVRPPCHAKCDRAEGCDGHEALADGDCDEILLRDLDMDRSVDKVRHPADHPGPVWEAGVEAVPFFRPLRTVLFCRRALQSVRARARRCYRWARLLPIALSVLSMLLLFLSFSDYLFPSLPLSSHRGRRPRTTPTRATRTASSSPTACRISTPRTAAPRPTVPFFMSRPLCVYPTVVENGFPLSGAPWISLTVI
jgi:hypothetical protein